MNLVKDLVKDLAKYYIYIQKTHTRRCVYKTNLSESKLYIIYLTYILYSIKSVHC